MVDSSDFAQVLLEAEDIARSVHQRCTSAHVLLALFTLENGAEVLLRERSVDEDVLLSSLTQAPAEPDSVVRELRDRAREIAQTCGARETECLHLLIAMTRVRCLAQQMLSRVGIDLTGLRNTALSYYLSGRMPRKLQTPKTRPTAQPQRDVAARPATATAVVAPPMPAASVRDLVDRAEEEAPAPAASPAPAAAPAPKPAPAPAAVPAAAPSAAPLPGLDPRAYPLLTALGRDLTALARAGKLDPVIGRSKEIEEVIDILGKRRTNNPCLVGEPGVGKTAIVEGVAQRLLEARGGLDEKVVVELDVASLVAGTQLRGSFSEKLNALKDEVRRSGGRVVVFIDEIHTLVGAGATAEGPQDAANELKAAMARGEFPCIGATTHDEFRKIISSDAALERRFTPVTVNEPSVNETIGILDGVIGRYAAHHRVTYSPQALEACATLGARYVTDRFLPDKAISIADLAGSRCRREGRGRVEAEDVARIVAALAGVPEERLLMNDSARLLQLEADLRKRIVGHDEAAGRIARVIRRNYAGFASRRPMGSFLFLGPTGVGKTEMARALADVLFGSRDALVRVDMSELSEPHSVSRLVGAPAGYVGYGDGGQLTEPVRRRPSSVVLLDEIEKACREVQLLLLQVLEEGRLTDGKGRHIDFSNTVLVMTSNLGAEAFTARPRAVGFSPSAAAGAAPESPDAELEAAAATARKALPPELWNRIDERLPFRPLREAEVARIATLLLAESSQRLSTERGIEYLAGEDVVGHLLRSGGFDPQLGARPMRQTVQRLVEAPLAERILQGEFSSGDRVRVAVEGGRLQFHRDG
jgi:ATP-dependent Clp protease ATP-binding subunit ClpC